MGHLPETGLKVICEKKRKDLLGSTPSNFGSLLLCRTGSKGHNVFFIEKAKARGLTWNPYHGVFDPQIGCIASATEEDIFSALAWSS